MYPPDRQIVGEKAMGFGMGAIGGMVLLGLGMLLMRRKQS